MALTAQHVTGMAVDTAALARRVADLFYDLKDYETRYGANALGIIALLDDDPAAQIVTDATDAAGNITGSTFSAADMLAARGTLATVMDAVVPSGTSFTRLGTLEKVL